MKIRTLPPIIRIARPAITVLFALAGVSSSYSALVTLNTSDTGAQSSFNTGVNWSDATAPSAGNTYSVGVGLTVRTPSASGSFVFGGDSLTLAGGSLVYKGTGVDTITVNLIAGGTATVSNFTTPAFTLAGTIAINATRTTVLRMDGANGGYTVSSFISGAGGLSFATTGMSSQAINSVSLTGTNNTYSGGTTIGNFAYLNAQADRTLGTGNVLMTGGRLTLELGTTNDYIANSASLILSTGLADGAIFLNYSTTDFIGGLSLDGGTTFLSTGTYDATTLNGLYGSSLFTGAGSFSVIPEPGVVSLLGIGFIILLLKVKPRRLLRAHSIKA